jgi:hypothetical protein
VMHVHGVATCHPFTSPLLPPTHLQVPTRPQAAVVVPNAQRLQIPHSSVQLEDIYGSTLKVVPAGVGREHGAEGRGRSGLQ